MWKNTYTDEVYCSATCALQATLEGASGVMSPERFQEYVEHTSIWATDSHNLAILNRAVVDSDACGEVEFVDRPQLDPDAVNLCDKCFKEL